MSSWYKQREENVRRLITTAIKYITCLNDEKDLNFRIARDFCLQNLKNHSFLSTNEDKIRDIMNG